MKKVKSQDFRHVSDFLDECLQENPRDRPDWKTLKAKYKDGKIIEKIQMNNMISSKLLKNRAFSKE